MLFCIFPQKFAKSICIWSTVFETFATPLSRLAFSPAPTLDLHWNGLPSSKGVSSCQEYENELYFYQQFIKAFES